MANYSMTCTCGHTMTLEAGSRDEAVSKFKAGMTQQALDDHMREHHKPDEPKPTLQQAHGDDRADGSRRIRDIQLKRNRRGAACCAPRS